MKTEKRDEIRARLRITDDPHNVVDVLAEKYLAYIRDVGESACKHQIWSVYGRSNGVEFEWVEGAFGMIPQRFAIRVEGRGYDVRFADCEGYNDLVAAKWNGGSVVTPEESNVPADRQAKAGERGVECLKR
jgi:hypothetical protein